jgi:hypothetical protein
MQLLVSVQLTQLCHGHSVGNKNLWGQRPRHPPTPIDRGEFRSEGTRLLLAAFSSAPSFRVQTSSEAVSFPLGVKRPVREGSH